MRSQFRPAIVSIAIFTLLLGVLYPLLITGIAQVIFPHQANGSLIVQNGQVVGSELIGQSFDDPRYFWGRPSATSPFPYNAAASTGSNLGPTNPVLLEDVKTRIATLNATDPTNILPIPVDLVTASGSGLDPDINVAAALYQVPRVAKARGLSEEIVRALVDRYTVGRQFGVLGELRINVLELNLALDEIK
ncbi:MAG: potassium-transporting ATPase subunit C [Chloroflexi bacterium RBG_19FT_COMBO_50_10]|nr:MAG: potassium-transporting ATPase subunit C [Chloroflexi bacterium RBG_19FT_COMBO_50_10]